MSEYSLRIYDAAGDVLEDASGFDRGIGEAEQHAWFEIEHNDAARVEIRLDDKVVKEIVR